MGSGAAGAHAFTFPAQPYQYWLNGDYPPVHLNGSGGSIQATCSGEPGLNPTDKSAVTPSVSLVADRAAPAAESAQVRAIRPKVSLLEREWVLGYLLLLPAIAIILTFKAYPFALGFWFSLTDKVVGTPGEFVGIANYLQQMKSQIFWDTARNTIVFTTMATIFKTILGMLLALILHRKFIFSRITRAVILLPFIVPTVLSGLAWLWMFDATFSVLNWVLTFFWRLEIPLLEMSIREIVGSSSTRLRARRSSLHTSSAEERDRLPANTDRRRRRSRSSELSRS